MNDTREIVRATYPDGHVEDWTTGPGISLSAMAMREFVRVCFKPTPSSVEIIETATLELPFEPPIT